MALQSPILKGNLRLEQASQGPPALKPLPTVEEPDAVARLQRALIQLGFLPEGFGVSMLSGDFFGLFGQSTVDALKAFQRSAFPTTPGEWDGVAGKNTLTKLDARLMLPKPPPKPAPVPDGTIRQTRSEKDIQAYSYGYMVVEPGSVTQVDPRTRAPIAFRQTEMKTPIRWFTFDVRRGGKKFWVGVAFPADLQEFNQAHVFFHPTTGQEPLYVESQYDEWTGHWSHLERYTPMIGSQLAAAKLKQVLIVPYMRVEYFNTLGLLQSEPVKRIEELLGAVQAIARPEVRTRPSLTALGASSFSVGISCLASFMGKVGPSGLLKAAFDFDGAFSNSPSKMLAVNPSGIFKKYSQGVTHLGVPGVFPAPMNRWQTFSPPPKTGKEVHAKMPLLFLHAASGL